MIVEIQHIRGSSKCNHGTGSFKKMWIKKMDPMKWPDTCPIITAGNKKCDIKINRSAKEGQYGTQWGVGAHVIYPIGSSNGESYIVPCCSKHNNEGRMNARGHCMRVDSKYMMHFNDCDCHGNDDKNYVKSIPLSSFAKRPNW